ncbi:MAG: fatty acid desaturase [Cyanobacteriota bacterium]|nr:fatty acid desaturase [Cyanobacteriota bacterium]
MIATSVPAEIPFRPVQNDATGSTVSARLPDWIRLIGAALIHLIAVIGGIYYFSWTGVLLVGFLHWLFGCVGIVVCFHRLLSHRSFRVPKWLEYFMALMGTLAMQNGPIFWVANHRMHHAFCDTEKDPYNIKGGFWWAHMNWIFFRKLEHHEYELYRKFAPDLDRDPFYRFLNRRQNLLQVILGLGLYVLGGWSWVIYGIFVRTVWTWHTTWLVNSAAHRWGTRPYTIADTAHNNFWVALLTFGEGWHNNHHHNPRRAQAGLTWWQIDPSWWVIWSLEKLGVANKVYRRERLSGA